MVNVSIMASMALAWHVESAHDDIGNKEAQIVSSLTWAPYSSSLVLHAAIS